MSRDIPFFEMFAELQLSGELRLKLAGAGADRRLHRSVPTMSIALQSDAPGRSCGGGCTGGSASGC